MFKEVCLLEIAVVLSRRLDPASIDDRIALSPIVNIKDHVGIRK
jgi:hypothetical protein